MNSETIAKSIFGAAVIAIAGGIFAGVDYLGSRDPDRDSFRVRGEVVEIIDEVYKKFGTRGRYTTPGEGIGAWFGSKIQKGMNIGNVETGYIVEPETLTYRTEGSIFFKPKTIEKDLSGIGQIPIISEVRLEDVVEGSQVQFEPKNDLTFMEALVSGRPKSLSVNSGDNKQKYEAPVLHPDHFSKIE